MIDPFRHAEDQYLILKGQLALGRITREQFEAALKNLMVKDAQERYWMLGAETGRWHMYDGQKWVPAPPPSAPPAPPSAPPVSSLPVAPEHVAPVLPPPPAAHVYVPLPPPNAAVVPLPPIGTPTYYPAPRRSNHIGLFALGGILVACILVVGVLALAFGLGALQVALGPSATPARISSISPSATDALKTALPIGATPGPGPTNTPPPTVTALRASTPANTPTVKPLPSGNVALPSSITIKYDDGVSADMREEINKGVAIAYETLGQAASVTVIAYANLDAMMAEQARLTGRSMDSPTIVANKSNFANGNVIAQANLNTISIYTAGGWKNATSAFRIQSLVHEYFHVIQTLRSQSAYPADSGPKWVLEGTAKYVENHTAAAYGLLKLEGVYNDALIAGAAFRNPLQSLETESGSTLEDYSSRYPLGYLAIEFLVSRYGEDGILTRYWQALATASTWQDAFAQAIGVTPDEFYREYEAFRAAQFPPICGPIRATPERLYAEPLKLRYVRQYAAGALTLSYASYSRPPNIAYAFCLDGISLAQAVPLAPKLKLPSTYAGWQSIYPNIMLVYMRPDTPSGEYTFGFDWGDKGKAETKFTHTPIATVATPVPLLFSQLQPPRTAVVPTAAIPVAIKFPNPGKFAFVSDRDGNQEIYTVNADGTQPARLTNNPAADTAPDWSPDGKRIAFSSLRDGNYEIYTMNADGSGLARLTNNQNTDAEPAWSRDGSKILFHSWRDGNWEVYAMNADGSAQTRLTNHNAQDSNPDWSPDGKRLAFSSERDGYGAIYIMNADGSGVTRVVGSNQAPAYIPVWSPDGKRIAYVSRARGNWEIHVVNTDGTGDKRLTDSWGASDSPAWSPDGNWVLFSTDRNVRHELYAVKQDGSQTLRITNLRGGDNRAPSLQPTGVVLATPGVPRATSVPPTATRQPPSPPTATPNVAPGIYVTTVRTEPVNVKDGQYPTFRVQFLNTLGQTVYYRWFVKIYEPDKKQSYGETAKLDVTLVPGTNTLNSAANWRGVGTTPCRQFIARVFYEAPDKTIVEFPQASGGNYYYYFTVCQ